MSDPAPLDVAETALLDVNVLIALCDPLHQQHDAAHAWFNTHAARGWATCAITENGFVRVASHPAYPNRLQSAEEAREILRRLTSLKGHEFWKDSVTLRDRELFTDLTTLAASSATDIYLLGLAAAQGGKLITFDQKLPARLVANGKLAIEVIPTKRAR
jgi:toxin-antitoxin system PIN domain toxin